MFNPMQTLGEAIKTPRGVILSQESSDLARKSYGGEGMRRSILFRTFVEWTWNAQADLLDILFEFISIQILCKMLGKLFRMLYWY